jgi:hypothetical protein
VTAPILATFARDYTDFNTVRAVFTAVRRRHPDAPLMHGDCPDGDQDGAAIWRDLGGIDLPRPADWHGPCRPQCRSGHRRRGRDGKSYCPAAGPYRNEDMLNSGPIVETHAFLTPGSRGAKGTAALSSRLRIPTFGWVLGEGLRSVPPYILAPYPQQIAVNCDHCDTEHRGDYLVRDIDTEQARFEYARVFLRAQGWRCDATGDHCPDCSAPTAPHAEKGRSDG